MALHGQNRTQKTLSVEGIRPVRRKAAVWTPKSIPGPHNKARSVPLMLVLRDVLGLAQSKREVRRILLESEVTVNGVRRVDERFPVGLFDVVELPATGKRFRALFDVKGRIALKGIEARGPISKVCKVLHKKTVKGGRVQYTLDDGCNVFGERDAYRVGSSVKVSLPEWKVEKVFPMEKGRPVYLIGGKHVGSVGVLEHVTEATMQRPQLAEVRSGGETYNTVARYVFVVGDKKPEMELSLAPEKGGNAK